MNIFDACLGTFEIGHIANLIAKEFSSSVLKWMLKNLYNEGPADIKGLGWFKDLVPPKDFKALYGPQCSSRIHTAPNKIEKSAKRQRIDEQREYCEKVSKALIAEVSPSYPSESFIFGTDMNADDGLLKGLMQELKDAVFPITTKHLQIVDPDIFPFERNALFLP